MGVSLTRTPGTPTSKKKFTFSLWYKKTTIRDYGASTSDGCFFNCASNNDNRLTFMINQENSPYDQVRLVGRNSGSQILDLRTNAILRDPSAWYHIVAKVDTTQSTNTDRAKLYINGTEQTLDTSSYPNQDVELEIHHTPYVLSYGGSSNYLEGYVTHFHYTDGYAYDASTFGETDSTSGIWKPKTAPSVTYGTNGFFLKFENSAAMGTDSSGQSNNLTVSGTFNQYTDSPTNNFATLNPLSTHGNNTLTAGNNKIAFAANTSYTNSIGNIGVSSGRWYAECKLAGVTTYYPALGFASMGNATYRYTDPLYTGAHLGADEGSAYFKHGNIQAAGSTVGNYASFTTGDIIGMYLDLESGTKTMKYYKNDSLIVSFTITPVDGQFYTFGATGTSSSDIADFNFGGGYFGTTAVASANADANGFGAFEYSPTLSGVNYYTLCTKNIKEFG